MMPSPAQSIASTISEYRRGAVSQPTEKHVLRWAKQLPAQLRDPLLDELDHLLKSTYLSKKAVAEFLRALIRNEKLVGDDPCAFWRDARLLDIQLRGSSQRDILRLFRPLLKGECGSEGTVARRGSDTFVYLDDVIFTGNHVRRDLEAWVSTDAPQKATVHVIVMATHEGSWYARGQLTKAINASKKDIDVHWWHCLKLEDRKAHINNADVLRPRQLPEDDAVRAYADSLEYEVVMREGDSCGAANLFSCEEGRSALEEALLIAGVRVREVCPHLPESQRPLGYTSLQMLGFGSMLVTYRNCPNNAPIALWAGDPWYPLFPRKTN